MGGGTQGTQGTLGQAQAACACGISSSALTCTVHTHTHVRACTRALAVHCSRSIPTGGLTYDFFCKFEMGWLADGRVSRASTGGFSRPSLSAVYRRRFFPTRTRVLQAHASGPRDPLAAGSLHPPNRPSTPGIENLRRPAPDPLLGFELRTVTWCAWNTIEVRPGSSPSPHNVTVARPCSAALTSVDRHGGHGGTHSVVRRSPVIWYPLNTGMPLECAF